MCWGMDPPDPNLNTGRCAAQCVGSENAPVCNDPTTSCVIGNEGSINICAQTCDPTNQNCPEGEACYGDLNTGNTVCLRPGTPLVSGPDLLFPAFCPPGSAAVAPELDVNCEDGEPCCVQWCDLTSVPQKCPGAVNCYPWIEEGMGVGTDDRGICLDVPSSP